MDAPNWDEAVGEEMWDQWGNFLGIVVDLYFVENTDKRCFPALELDNGTIIDVTWMKLEA